VRIHKPPHLSQYFSSSRTISKPSISMTASVALNSLINFGRKPEASFLEANEKALCRLLGHRARFSYGEPVNLFSYEYNGPTNHSPQP
jgi:hypothetical protein